MPAPDAVEVIVAKREGNLNEAVYNNAKDIDALDHRDVATA